MPELKWCNFNLSSWINKLINCHHTLFVSSHTKRSNLRLRSWIGRNKVARFNFDLLGRVVFGSHVNELKFGSFGNNQVIFKGLDCCGAVVTRVTNWNHCFVVINPDNFEGVIVENCSEEATRANTVLVRQGKGIDLLTQSGDESFILLLQVPLYHDCFTTSWE